MNEREKIKDQDRLWKLMADKLAGEATEDDLTELQAMQAKYPEVTYGLQLLEDLWKPAPPIEKEDHDEAFTRHLFRMAEKNAERAQEFSAQSPDQPSNQQSSGNISQSSFQSPANPITPQWGKQASSKWNSGNAKSRWKDALRTKSLYSSLLNSSDQFKNYFRAIRRTFLRNKGFSLINLLGLAMGMASAFLILLWIKMS